MSVSANPGQIKGSSGGKNTGFYYGYVIVFAGFLILMVQYGAQYSFGVFFKPLLEDFGWTRALTSGVYSINVILQGFLGILAGRLTDRFGPRLTLTISGILLGSGYLLMSRVQYVWQIYLFYGLLISAGSVIWVPMVSTVVRWFVKRRGLMCGILASGIGFGILTVPLLANHLIASFNWRISYIIVGSIAMTVIIIAAQFLKRDPGQIGLPAYGASEVNGSIQDVNIQGLSFREAIRTRQCWMIAITFFTTNFCTQMVIVHIVPHATDIGISAVAAATILSAVGVFSIVSKITLGRLIDRLGTKFIISAVTVLMIIAFLWLLQADKLWMFYLFTIVFAFGYGGASAVQSPIVADFFGLKSHGAILGFILIGNFAGGAVGPLVAGRLFDLQSSYALAFIICAAISGIALILTLSLKPIRG
jgi:MFS family permease